MPNIYVKVSILRAHTKVMVGFEDLSRSSLERGIKQTKNPQRSFLWMFEFYSVISTGWDFSRSNMSQLHDLLETWELSELPDNLFWWRSQIYWRQWEKYIQGTDFTILSHYSLTTESFISWWYSGIKLNMLRIHSHYYCVNLKVMTSTVTLFYQNDRWRSALMI